MTATSIRSSGAGGRCGKLRKNDGKIGISWAGRAKHKTLVRASVRVHARTRVCICPDALNDSSPNESTNDPSVSCEGLGDERGPTGRPQTTEWWGTTPEHDPTG